MSTDAPGGLADDGMGGAIPYLPPAADENIFDDAEEQAPFVQAREVLEGPVESEEVRGFDQIMEEADEAEVGVGEVTKEDGLGGVAQETEGKLQSPAADDAGVKEAKKPEALEEGTEPVVEGDADGAPKEPVPETKKDGSKEGEAAATPAEKLTPRRSGRGGKAKAATDEKPKRGRGRPRKSDGDPSLKIDIASGTVSYGRRKMKAAPAMSKTPPPRGGGVLPPHMMVAAPWAAGWFPQPYPFAPQPHLVQLAPRPTPGAAAAAVEESPPPPGPFKRFYAIRKSAKGCPVPVKNCLFTCWDDCKPFIRPKDAAKGGNGKKTPPKKKGRGRPKKGAAKVEEDEEPEEGEDGKYGRAEFGVFDTPGEAFMYLAAGTKEGAAAMASVAALKSKLPEPPKAASRANEGGEDDADEEEGAEKGEGEGEGEEGEGAEDPGWLKVYTGEKGEAPPKRKREDGEGEKTPAKKKRGRPKKEGGDDGDEKPAAKKSPDSAAKSPRSPKPRYLTKKWLGMFDKLREYKEEHGTATVPTNCRDDLYKWIREQRVQYKFLLEKGPDKSSMYEEKIKLLRELDFDFSKPEQDDPQTGEVRSSRPLSEKWLGMLQRATVFVEKHGSFDALEADKNLDLELFGWIREQRYYHKIRFDGSTKNKDNSRLARVMHDQKIRRLEAIGFDFTAKEVAREQDWENNFDLLKEYKSNHGNCNVPLSKKGEVRNRFQTWCVQQRLEYKNLRDGKKTRMTLERMTRLNDVGFAFLTRERYVNWETRMEQTRQFAADNGHCNIPVDHSVLGEFTCKMRRHYKLYLDGKPCSINPHKIEQLNSVGFVWLAGKRWTTKSIRKSWEERFGDMLEYKEVHGHTNVPQSYPGLGVWVKEQRKEYKKMVKGIPKAKMSAEKALRLSEVGFLFEIRTGTPGGRRSGVEAEAEAEPEPEPEPQPEFQAQAQVQVQVQAQLPVQPEYTRDYRDYTNDYKDYTAFQARY